LIALDSFFSVALCASSVFSVIESSIASTGSVATAAERVTPPSITENTEEAQRATEQYKAVKDSSRPIELSGFQGNKSVAPGRHGSLPQAGKGEPNSYLRASRSGACGTASGKKEMLSATARAGP